MTPAQINNALERLKAMVGPKAYIAITMSSDTTPVRAVIYPRGVTDMSLPALHVNAATFEEVFAELDTVWLQHRAKHHHVSIRKMALEIIDLTHRSGQCTEAELRKSFPADEIKFFGSDALTMAAEMSGGRQFFILPEPAALAA